MGRRQIGKSKKRPSDYPQFNFRASKAQIERLTALVAKIQAKRNKRKGPDEPFAFKSDIIVEALEIGLDRLK